MRLTWLGGASLLVELGAVRVLLDPSMREAFAMGPTDVTRTTPWPDVALDGLDALCLTCARADHYDPEIVTHVGARAPVFVPASAGECLEACGHAHVREVPWFESARIASGDDVVTVTATPAPSDNGDDNGWWFVHENAGRTLSLFVSGDTRFGEHVRRIETTLGHADVFVVHLGDERSAAGTPASCDAADAMQFVFRVQPRAIVPVHHTTFTHYREPVERFVEAAGRTIYDRRIHRLAPGEAYAREAGAAPGADRPDGE